MCVVSGILTDYIGVNFTVLLFFSMVAIGQGIFVIGCWSQEYLLMLAGRFVYGMGYESYYAAINAFIYEYFHHKELGFAMAILQSLDVIGASINDTSTYYIYIQTNSIVIAVSVGFILLTTSLIVLFIFVCHRIRSNIARKQDIKIINEPSEKFKLSDIKQFGALYWILTMYMGASYGMVLSWMNVGTDFLQKTYGYDHKKANILLMIPYIISGFTSPIAGVINDRIGKRAYLMLIVSVILVLTHLFFGWIHEVTPIVPLCGLGLSYSIFCAVIWPSVAQIVDERYIGTAYGIPVSIYSLMNSINFVAVGALTNNDVSDNTMKYVNVEWFLLGWSCVSSVLAVSMIYVDKRTGGRLSEPTIKDKDKLMQL
eukprot:455673_1